MHQHNPFNDSQADDSLPYFRYAFDHCPDAGMLVDPFKGVILRANQTARALFASSVGDVAGATIDQCYPDQRGPLHAFTDEVLHRGHARTRDLRLFDGNGRQRQVEHLAVTTRHHDVTRMIIRVIDLDAMERRSINNDVNQYHRQGLGEWQRIERYFQDVERENQLILSAAGEGIYGVNAQGITTFLNPAGEHMLGYQAGELVGTPMHETIHHHHADGSLHPVEDCPIYAVLNLGVVNKVEDDVFWRKDGKPIRVEYTSTPIVNGGKVDGAVIVFRDITERKQNEERLRATQEENARLRERLEMENAYLQEEILSQSNHHEILGSSDAVAQAIRQIDLVAPTDANVLITGESGTGKELVARAIHKSSTRQDRPLIRVNCAAIPRELFESEFFGHIKGAFTGAVRDRVGRFELANGGTIFLDEVGEIPLDLQSKLLRVLQDQRFERVGEDKTRKVDVRVIAATNRDLKEEVAAGRFREDLYFRLNVFPLECQPLRERKVDIPVLAAHFLDMCCARMNLPRPTLTNANIASLQAYDWPGNIRELQNVVERAAILIRQGKILFNLPQSESLHADPHLAAPAPDTTLADKNTPILTMQDLATFERHNIRRALNHCQGKVSGPDGAATLLGIKPTTLYSKLRKLGL